MRLKELLADNPAWSEPLSEQVLQQYLQLRYHRLGDPISVLGREEVEQLLRIRLWELWSRFDSARGAPLYQWLVCNLDRYLINIATRNCKHALVEVPLGDLTAQENTELDPDNL